MKRSFNFSYLVGTFFVDSDWFGVPFPKLLVLFGIFWVLRIDYSLYEKAILGIFVNLFISEVTVTKVSFCFYKQCSQAATLFICKKSILANNSSNVFCSVIFLYIEKNPVKKLYIALWMELKTNGPVGSNFVFEKIRFKPWHDI